MPKLTKVICEQAKYGGDAKRNQRSVLWDEKLSGFGLRVFPSGVKSFVVTYRTSSGAKRMMTIGPFGAFTVEQARDRARDLLHSARRGEDPLAAKEKARTGETMKDLADLYLKREAKHLKTGGEIERRINKWILPKLGSKKVADVTTADISRLHYKIGDSAPVEANRVRTILHRMFELARKWGITERTHANPVADVEKFKERSRERAARANELPALWRAIQSDSDLHARTAVALILFTGCRRNEVLNLKWGDVDFTRRTLRLTDTKADEPQTVPLSDEAIALLNELPRGIGNTRVFPHVTIKRAWQRIRARWWLSMHADEATKLRKRAEADVAKWHPNARTRKGAVEVRLLKLAAREIPAEENITIHDLRRTVGSLMAEHVAPTVVGKALRNPSAVHIYTRVSDRAAREALQDHGARLAALVKRRTKSLS